MKVVCKGCGKGKRINPSDIKNIDEYYCRRCRPQHFKRTKKDSEWDWSTLKYLNNLAMSKGHESIFKNRVSNGTQGDTPGFRSH